MAIQTIKLNLIPGGVMPVVNVSQYDDKRQFHLDVYEGAESYSLTGKTVEIRGTKPDMHGFSYGVSDGVISVSGNRVTVITMQQMTACHGQVMAELKISQNSVAIATINFIIECEPSALSDDTIISDTDIPFIERNLEEAVAEAEAEALKSEGHAQGTQDGTPVSSGSPYYHNNSAYYSGQASDYATSAGNSATAAGNSATSAGNNALKSEGYAVGKQNGSDVASGSPYYHNNASYYASQASNSATSAGNSATAAGADALEAEGFAVGEQNGVPVSSGSPYYHNNAKYYSQQSDHTALSTLTDVNLSSPTNDQVLKYNGTSGKWENKADAGGASTLNELTDVTVTSPTSGQALKYDGSKWVNGAISGVPTGGTTGQALTKASNTSGDVQWSDVATPNDLKAKWDKSSQKVSGAYNVLPNTAASMVQNGVTFTVNTDGTITASTVAGTPATGVASIYVYGATGGVYKKDPTPGTRKLVGCPNKGGCLLVANLSQDGSTFDSSVESSFNGAIVPYKGYIQVYCRVASGTDLSTPVTFKPMITPDLNATYDDYVPYAKTNRELTIPSAYNYYTRVGNVVNVWYRNNVTFSGAAVTLPISVPKPAIPLNLVGAVGYDLSFPAFCNRGYTFYNAVAYLQENGTIMVNAFDSSGIISDTVTLSLEITYIAKE